MKKLLGIVFVLALLAVIAPTGVNALDCSSPLTAGCGGGGNPQMLSMQWGLTGGQTPIVKGGSVITDEKGYTFDCPAWIGQCYDLTQTDWYKAQMRALAQMGFYLNWR